MLAGYNYCYIFFGSLALLQIFLIYKLLNYKKLLDQKNIQILEYSLDRKFWCDLLANLLRTENKVVNLNIYLAQITKFYDFEQNFLYFEQNNEFKYAKEKNSIFDLEYYVAKNLSSLKSEMNISNFAERIIFIGKTGYHLQYVNFSDLLMENSFFIWVNKYTGQYEKNQKTNLENKANMLRITCVLTIFLSK